MILCLRSIRFGGSTMKCLFIHLLVVCPNSSIGQGGGGTLDGCCSITGLIHRLWAVPRNLDYVPVFALGGGTCKAWALKLWSQNANQWSTASKFQKNVCMLSLFCRKYLPRLVAHKHLRCWALNCFHFAKSVCYCRNTFSGSYTRVHSAIGLVTVGIANIPCSCSGELVAVLLFSGISVHFECTVTSLCVRDDWC